MLFRSNGANIPTVGVTGASTSSSTTTGALIVTGGTGIGGNLYVAGNTTTGNNAVVAGVTNTLLANSTASFSANVNSYTQITYQNKSTGADATADFILTADNGNDTTNYGPIQYGLDNANTGAISFTQFSGAQTLVAGQGLTKVGTTIGANANITNYGPVSLLPNSGSGYSAFSIGGYVSGIAGTSYTATLRVGTGNTYGVGTANIVLNHTGFSMAGGTNTSKTLTITGDISIPSPTQYAIAYGADTSTLAFTSAAAGSGASVLTQTLNNNPVYLGQSQLVVGGATTAGYVVTDSSTATRYLIGTPLNSV